MSVTQPTLMRRPGSAPTCPASSAPSFCSSTANRRRRSTSRRPPIVPWPIAWAADRSCSGPSTSAATSHWATSTWCPRPTHFSACGIRLALARPSLLRDQLAAICRLAVDRPVSVMFPMVTHVAEVVAARAQLSEAAALVGTGPCGATGRHHDRGSGGRAQGVGIHSARRLRQHRHQRPDPVHAGGRPRQ